MRFHAPSTRRYLEAVHAGQRTTDPGDKLYPTEFTDEVIGRVGAQLEVWKELRR